MKKTTALLLALLMMSALLCPAAYAEGKPFDGLEFSILCTTWSPYSTETTLIPQIEEMTGAKINVEWALKTDFDARVNSILTSVDDLPDVIMGASLIPLLDQEAIIPLDPYLTKENTPNILAALDDKDYMFLRNVNDGYIYEMPSVFDFPPVNSWVIRTDWMEQAGLTALNSWEDWLTYWRYVRDHDVNGNGDATDERPISTTYRNFVCCFVPTASSSSPFYCITDDNQYTVIYETEGYKEYLKAMVDLYAEKLLVSENITGKTADFKTMATSGIGGTMLTAAEWSMTITDALRETTPTAKFECVAPITATNGNQVMNARPKVSTRGVITVAGEDRAADIMALFDWLYSKEGAELINYGIENVHHQVVDGQKKLLSPYVDSFVNARGAGLIFQPFPFLWYADNYTQILLGGKSYDELSETQKFFYDGLYLNEPYFVVTAPVLKTEAYVEYGTDITKLLTEAEASCIIGDISIDEFWKTYEQAKAMGMDEIIEQAAAAWKMVSGN